VHVKNHLSRQDDTQSASHPSCAPDLVCGASSSPQHALLVSHTMHMASHCLPGFRQHLACWRRFCLSLRDRCCQIPGSVAGHCKWHASHGLGMPPDCRLPHEAWLGTCKRQQGRHSFNHGVASSHKIWASRLWEATARCTSANVTTGSRMTRQHSRRRCHTDGSCRRVSCVLCLSQALALCCRWWYEGGIVTRLHRAASTASDRELARLVCDKFHVTDTAGWAAAEWVCESRVSTRQESGWTH
jgi:hypothetical protein